MLRRFVRSIRRSAPAVKGRAASFESLERRQLLAVSPVFAGTKIKGINLSENNVSINSTLITIPFTGNINIADQSKIQVRGYAINPMSANLGQVKKVVNVLKTEIVESDFDNDGVKERQYLQIWTDRLMRKGGQIILYEGGLVDDNGDVLAQQTVKTLKGQNKERFTLACRLFTPQDMTRYTNNLFAASPNPSAKSNVIDEPTATSQLSAFLDKKVAAGTITQAQKDAAMTRFASTAAKGTVPDHNLRAALFSLTGTFAESAIASYLDGANVTGKPYTIIAFQDPGDSTVPVAKTTARDSDGRLRTVFRPEFQGEPLQVLSAWLAHEALHQDNVFSLQEEVVATSFHVLLNAQQAIVDPSYLKTPTKLVNQENENLLALLNSGRTIFPYVGLLDGPNLNKADGVFRGQKAVSGGVYKSFDDYVRRQYVARGAVSQNTAGNQVLRQYYTRVTGVEAPANLQFSDAIINQIDAFQEPMGIKGAIIIAQALRVSLS